MRIIIYLQIPIVFEWVTNYYRPLLTMHGLNDVEQIEIHIAEKSEYTVNFVQHGFAYTCKNKWEQLFAECGKCKYTQSAHSLETLHFGHYNVIMFLSLNTKSVL
jgi:hypothetical protein